MILSSSLGDGKCYIETANLDGEANLKIRQANSGTMALEDDAAKLGGLRTDGLPAECCYCRSHCWQGAVLTAFDVDAVV